MINEELLQLLLSILDSDYQLDAHYVRSKGWCVVPVESGSHFDESDIQKIANAIDASHYDKLNAFLLDIAEEVPKYVFFDSTVRGLQEFNQKCAHFNYAICPDDLSFLIVCTTYDYFMIAGSQRFVESVLGSGIQTCREEFDRFAEDEPAVLQQIASRYKEISAS